MATEAYDLSRLDPTTFENLANILALKVIGSGVTSFGPGADGGRDGFYEGTAPYPSETDQWTGKWYIQSKFHKPHLSKDPQAWLLEQIKSELDEFAKAAPNRTWPNNLILVTNIDPSAVPKTGTFDKANELVASYNPALAGHFHIWGGSKILNLLTLNPPIARRYAEFITAGDIIAQLSESLVTAAESRQGILRSLIVTEFDEQQYTRLEQAGFDQDSRPRIQDLYVDIPFHTDDGTPSFVLRTLSRTLALKHQDTLLHPPGNNWLGWSNEPQRARNWLIKGGPGQGKSTSTQYVTQINRAALILAEGGPVVTYPQRVRAEQIKERAEQEGDWPISPRIPISIDLKELAQWYSQIPDGASAKISAFLTKRFAVNTAENTTLELVKSMLSKSRWLIVFDGLDEVPAGLKDPLSKEIVQFANDFLIGLGCDAVVICTSRPQGYSGQLDKLDAAIISLAPLGPQQALACAKPVLTSGRTPQEASRDYAILEQAISANSVREIMTTPLQSHIMAVVIRSGGKPPERRWQLFNDFYKVIKRRESGKNVPERDIATLLNREDKLLKRIHSYLGITLHRRAQTNIGATSALNRDEFQRLATEVVESLKDSNIDDTIATVMRATTERLVLVNTPENGEKIRFDIRPLQEFFAAEFIHENSSSDELLSRFSSVRAHPHWREVLHFLVSAFVETDRRVELSIATGELQKADLWGRWEDFPSLSRTLAMGSHLASQLLGEGVLEQDRRVRHEFSRCFDALFASTDAPGIISRIQPADSRNWFIGLLIEALSQNAEAENIGAALLARHLIEDGDVRADAVALYVTSSSLAYRSVFLSKFRVSRNSPAPESRNWLIDLIVSLLRLPDWNLYDASGIASALSFLEASGSGIQGALARAFQCDETVSAIAQTVSFSPPLKSETEAGKGFGYVEHRFEVRDPDQDPAKWSDKVLNELENDSGFFHEYGKLVALSIKLSSGASPTSEDTERAIYFAGIVPSKMMVGIQLDHQIDAPDVHGPEPKLSIDPARRQESVYMNIGATEHRDVRGFFRSNCVLAHFACTLEPKVFAEDAQALLHTEADLSLIANVIRHKGAPMGTFVFFTHLVGKSGISSQARYRLGAALPTLAEDEVSRVSPIPFRLNLDEEYKLLVFVLIHLSREYPAELLMREEEVDMERDSIDSIVRIWCPDIAILLEIYNSERFDNDVRVSALMVWIYSPDNRASVALRMDAVAACASAFGDSVSPRVLALLLDMLKAGFRTSHVETIKALEKILSSIRPDLRSRVLIEPEISYFREIQESPGAAVLSDSLWALS